MGIRDIRSATGEFEILPWNGRTAFTLAVHQTPEKQDVRGTIRMQLEHDPTPEQWEALKALRAPAAMSSAVNPLVIDELIALGFATNLGGLTVITPSGRKVLVRGSPRLLDVAA